MENFHQLVLNTKAIWSREYEIKAIETLRGWDQLGPKRKSDTLYNLRKNYVIKDFAGVSKIVTKKNFKLMVTKESVMDIIRDIHESSGHTGEKKTHKKIKENYANISRTLVSEYIKYCERCAEKLKKKKFVVKPS